MVLERIATGFECIVMVSERNAIALERIATGSGGSAVVLERNGVLPGWREEPRKGHACAGQGMRLKSSSSRRRREVMSGLNDGSVNRAARPARRVSSSQAAASACEAPASVRVS